MTVNVFAGSQVEASPNRTTNLAQQPGMVTMPRLCGVPNRPLILFQLDLNSCRAANDILENVRKVASRYLLLSQRGLK